MQNARNEVANLTKSATDAEARFGVYRAGVQGQLSDLQQENETVQMRLTSFESKYIALQRTYKEQSRRLAEATAQISSLSSTAASSRAGHRLELDRLREENRLLAKRGAEARVTVADREAELERMSETMSEQERIWDERRQRDEHARKVAEKRVDDYKVVIENLNIANGNTSDVSPAAALASRQRESGKSYTQFYTDYAIMETKLREKAEQVEHLEGVLDEISRDMEERVSCGHVWQELTFSAPYSRSAARRVGGGH